MLLLLLLLEQQMLMQCVLLGWREMWMRVGMWWHVMWRQHVIGMMMLWRCHQMMWWCRCGRGRQHGQAGSWRCLGRRAGSVALELWTAGLLRLLLLLMLLLMLLLIRLIACGDNSRRIVANNRIDAEANLLLGCGQHDG